jgi:hypothetical protein
MFKIKESVVMLFKELYNVAKVLILLFFIVVVLKYNHVEEGFACISREYVRVEEEDESVRFDALQSLLCPNLTDDECNDYKADCVKIDMDEEIIEDDSEESEELLKMFETCLKKDTHIKMDEKCLQAMLSKPTNVRSRVQDSRTKPLNFDKCFLKNKQPKYVFDEKCELL